jgi:hypothetical protein
VTGRRRRAGVAVDGRLYGSDDHDASFSRIDLTDR